MVKNLLHGLFLCVGLICGMAINEWDHQAARQAHVSHIEAEQDEQINDTRISEYRP